MRRLAAAFALSAALLAVLPSSADALARAPGEASARASDDGAGDASGGAPGNVARRSGAEPAARAARSRDEVQVGAPAAETLAGARAAARAALAEQLNELAAWCNVKELFIERDRIWRKVIEIAPDDAAARKGLRYARNIDGTWKEPPPRKLENLGKKHLPDLAPREAAAYAPYGDALLALAQAPERTPAERDELVAELRALAPDHAGLHAWLGNVRLDDRWVLPETAAAKARRGEIRTLARQLLSDAPPLPRAVAHASETALGVPWSTILQGQNVRVVSTAPEDETQRIGRAVEGVGALLGGALGGEMRYPAGFTIYVLAAPGEKQTFLEALPGLDAAERARLAGLESTGLPATNNVALFAKDPAYRADAAVRHAIGHVLGLSVGVTRECAWAWEGIGLYLTREFLGTRLTWFVSESADPAASGLRGKLMNPETNWIQEAYDLLVSGAAVPLHDLMRRSLDDLDVAGALTSYALTAYLLEGQGPKALEFARRSALRPDPAAITRELFGQTPDEFQARVVQWLSERR